MSKHAMPPMTESGVNVTPLIDIVMCLIIFFMLVAKIGVSTGAAKMQLPETIIGTKIEKLGSNLVVNVLNSPETFQNDPTTGLPRKNERGQIVRRRLGDPYLEVVVTAMTDQFSGKGEAKEIKLRRDMAGQPPEYPFRRVLEEVIKGNKAKGLKPNPEFAVTLRAEKDIEFRLLQLVLAEIAQAGVKNINYATVGKKAEAPPPAAP